MSPSSVLTSPVHLKALPEAIPPAHRQIDGAGALEGKRKNKAGRLILLLLVGAIVVTGATLWYMANAGFVETDDATIESHVIQVSPKISTHVKAVHFDDNYEVKRGDLLIELDPRDAEVSVVSARANLASAKSKLAEAQATQEVAAAGLGQAKADRESAEANAENAAADFRRNENLYQTRVIDRREYDASTAQTKTAAATAESAAKRVASQEAQVQLASAQQVTASAEEKQAEAQLQQAELQLSYTRIFAPFDGRVTKKSVEPGNYVQPGQTLFSLVPPEVWVVANFKETELREMKVGQPVSIKVDAFPGREFKAHVESFQVGTGSRFTLLPPENATGNYVKVVQRLPVKIVFDESFENLGRLWAGESVEPRVNVRNNFVGQPHRASPLENAILGATEEPVSSIRQ
jgi:membrane fusion protein, multidrug efflux system